MKCPRCRHDNPPAAKFCAECGAALARSCSRCGSTLPPAAKFCPECSHPVGAAPEPAAYTPRHLAERILDSRAALEGERKQVTVLFADLKGSMELLADRDPEEARKILDPVLERMMEAVHRYEGTVNQVMGDGIMALFGAPLAHEDHAVRGCYAALRMQEAIRRYTEEVRRTHGVEVQIRVGLNSGEVVVRSIGSDLRMDYTAVGQTTHLAARMEQLATPGSIRLTAATLALAEGYLEVKAIGPVPVKGLAEPVDVYELAGAGAARTRLQAAQARGFSRFVGRDPELDHLRHTAAEVRRARGRLVAVVGEPGVGKSRLYYEFIHSHHVHDWLVLEAGSVSYGKATPYLPLADLLRSYFKIGASDDTRSIRIKVTGGLLTLDEALKDAVPAALWLLDALAEDSSFLALEPAERRRQTLAAVKRVLLRESQLHPLMLVFEDLHWIDGETQAFLDSFVESLPAAAILLAVNYRPEYRHGWTNKPCYSQIRVDPLAPDSAQGLLDALLGPDPGVAALKQLLIERTAGSPLFLEESVRTLIETRALVGERGAYRLAQAPGTLQVPPTVQAIITARIDRLDPEEKRMLQAAAVIGTHVPFTLLLAIAETDEEGLRRCLAQLQGAEFVYEAQLFPDLEYAFKHALTHEVAYGSVLQDRRRALHAQIVDAIERLYPDRLAEQAERLAHHAARAGIGHKAVRYLREAASKAVGRSANREAVAYFQEALALLDELPQTAQTMTESLEVRLALGPALISLKGPPAPEVEQLYRAALEAVERIGADNHRFPAIWGLWYVNFTRGRLREALETGERLLETARASDDTGELLEAHHSLWPTLHSMGRSAEAIVHMERGFALYDRERHGKYAFLYAGHDPGACCRWHMGSGRWLMGYPDDALRYIRDAYQLAEELRHPLTTVIALWHAAWLHWERGEGELAVASADRLLSLVTQHEFSRWTYTADVFTAYQRGRPGMDAIAKLYQQVASSRLSTFRGAACLNTLVRLCLDLGYVEQGLRVLRSISEEDRMAVLAPEWLRLEGELLLKQSAPANTEAKRRFDDAIVLARLREQKSLELRAASSLARLLDEQGRREEAHAALAPVYGWFTEGHDTADLKAARSLLDSLN